jgi:Fe-S cluster assembly scaffold protein SufB
MENINIQDNTKEEIKLEEDATIKIGKNAEVQIMDVVKTNEERNVNLEVGEGAKINYISVQFSGSSIKEATIGDKGKINWVDCCLGEGKSKIKTNLKGKESESESLSVVFGNGNEIFEGKNEVVHSGSESKSNMLSRIVLNDKAKAIYDGLVKINSNAKGCEGYQKKEAILLSGEAKVESIPNLEIANNDVKCSHGATISQIDEDKLFYMMSRGVSENEAKKTIIEGFFDPILIKVEEDIRNEIKNLVSKKL